MCENMIAIRNRMEVVEPTSPPSTSISVSMPSSAVMVERSVAQSPEIRVTCTPEPNDVDNHEVTSNNLFLSSLAAAIASSAANNRHSSPPPPHHLFTSNTSPALSNVSSLENGINVPTTSTTSNSNSPNSSSPLSSSSSNLFMLQPFLASLLNGQCQQHFTTGSQSQQSEQQPIIQPTNSRRSSSNNSTSTSCDTTRPLPFSIDNILQPSFGGAETPQQKLQLLAQGMVQYYAAAATLASAKKMSCLVDSQSQVVNHPQADAMTPPTPSSKGAFHTRNNFECGLGVRSVSSAESLLAAVAGQHQQNSLADQTSIVDSPTRKRRRQECDATKINNNNNTSPYSPPDSPNTTSCPKLNLLSPLMKSNSTDGTVQKKSKKSSNKTSLSHKLSIEEEEEERKRDIESLANASESVVDGEVPPGMVRGPNGQLWPAWVFCTRYSDRPSSGPRARKVKKKKVVVNRADNDTTTSTTTENGTPICATNGGVNSSIVDDKRPRTAFTADQLTRLRKEFNDNRYLNEDRRKALADELNLNETQIKIWFQNKRAKLKKSSGDRGDLAKMLAAQGLYNHATISIDEDDDTSTATAMVLNNSNE